MGYITLQEEFAYNQVILYSTYILEEASYPGWRLGNTQRVWEIVPGLMLSFNPSFAHLQAIPLAKRSLPWWCKVPCWFGQCTAQYNTWKNNVLQQLRSVLHYVQEKLKWLTWIWRDFHYPPPPGSTIVRKPFLHAKLSLGLNSHQFLFHFGKENKFSALVLREVCWTIHCALYNQVWFQGQLYPLPLPCQNYLTHWLIQECCIWWFPRTWVKLQITPFKEWILNTTKYSNQFSKTEAKGFH